MASIENYIPDTVSKKKPSFLTKAGNAFLDTGLATLDSALGVVGQGDIITSDMYKTTAGKTLDKVAGVTGAIGNAALGIATSGLSSKILPKSFKNGGERLIDINGNSHELGGVPLGNDEAEGGETLFDSGQSQFIFSDSINHPIKKKETFATMSKTIRNKYKGREFDSLANKAKEKELSNLAALQESLKPKEKVLGNKFEGGGLRDRLNIQNSLNNNPMQLPLPNQLSDINAPIQPFSLPTDITYPIVEKLSDRKINKFARKAESVNFALPEEDYISDIPFDTKKIAAENITTPTTGFKNMSALPQIIGYGAQALANLPGLFTKPERVKYDRVTPDLVNLSAEREALTQDRNLSRAISRKTAAGSNNVGQALNFLGASESDLSRQFGQNISKSFQTEANLNSEIKNKAAMFNAEISRAEQDANAAERDAAKGTRLQSLSNIGSIAALGVKDWMDTKYKLAQLGALDTGDFVYVSDRWGNPVKKEKKYNADGTWDGKSFKN